MNRLIRIALTFLLVMTSGVIQAEIVIYPVPQGIYYARHNDDYTVKVRQVGEKDWVDLYEYNVKVDMDTKSDATMVQFDFSGKVEVLVQKNNGEIYRLIWIPSRMQPWYSLIFPVKWKCWCKRITGNSVQQ